MPDERTSRELMGGPETRLLYAKKADGVGDLGGGGQDKIAVSVEAAGCTIRILRRDLEADDAPLDPCFFEPSYTVAGATGFVVWEGSWMLMNYVATQMADEVRGRRVVELGSGTGLAGLFIAAYGAHVLMTDLPSVVTECLMDNIALNSGSSSNSSRTCCGEVTTDNARSLPAAASDAVAGEQPAPQDEDQVANAVLGVSVGGVAPAVPSDARCGWENSTPIGLLGGSATAQALDWVRPVKEQAAPLDFADADIILAAEVVWLKELVEPFVITLVTLLSSPKRPRCYMAYHNRGSETSVTFATTDDLLSCLRDHGCVVKLVTEGVPPRAGISCVIYAVTLRE